jgi:hypothetical protein
VENEIISPPYPTGSTSPEKLFEHLADLITWTAEHQDWANEQFERLDAPEDYQIDFKQGSCVTRTAFFNTSVKDMYGTWRAMRVIREQYDDVVRNYESADAWQSDPAIFLRINLVKAASVLLSVAFLDSEKREAKEMEMLAEQRKIALSTLKKQLGNLKSLFELEEDKENEIDFDRLFNPEEDA